MSVKNNVPIAQKMQQLEELLEWFESDNVTVETALKKYEQALVLAKDLKIELETAKNQVEVLKQKYNE